MDPPGEPVISTRKRPCQKIQNGSEFPELVAQNSRNPQTKHRRVDFNCPEGATFSQPRLRKSVDRYASRNQNSVLVVLRNPLKSEGYQGRSPWLVSPI